MFVFETIDSGGEEETKSQGLEQKKYEYFLA